MFVPHLLVLFAPLVLVVAYARHHHITPRVCAAHGVAAGLLAFSCLWAIDAASHQYWHCQHYAHASEAARACETTVNRVVLAGAVFLSAYVGVIAMLYLRARRSSNATG